MNITDLLKLDKQQLLTLIRQVADRVRACETPQKYRGLKKKLLEACDLVLPGDVEATQAEGGRH